MAILHVTIGTTNGSVERDFIIPDDEFATYIGLEIDHVNDESVKGRMTILRTPFIQHGITPIHTMCRFCTDEIEEVEL